MKNFFKLIINRFCNLQYHLVISDMKNSSKLYFIFKYTLKIFNIICVLFGVEISIIGAIKNFLEENESFVL